MFQKKKDDKTENGADIVLPEELGDFPDIDVYSDDFDKIPDIEDLDLDDVTLEPESVSSQEPKAEAEPVQSEVKPEKKSRVSFSKKKDQNTEGEAASEEQPEEGKKSRISFGRKKEEKIEENTIAEEEQPAEEIKAEENIIPEEKPEGQTKEEKKPLLSFGRKKESQGEKEPTELKTVTTPKISLPFGKKEKALPESEADSDEPEFYGQFIRVPSLFLKNNERLTLPEYDFERDGSLVDPQFNPKFKLIESYWIQPGLVKIVIANSPANEYLYLVFEPELTPFEKDVLEKMYEAVREIVVLKDIDTSGDKIELLYDAIDMVFERYLIEPSSETVYKIRYYLKRNMFGWGIIDALRGDPNIEDISCDGYGIPIFLYHRKYRTIKTSILFTDQKELDSLVVLFAQKSGKHISYATPIVDTSLSDGSRAQLTYGEVTSSNGSSFTIRKFREVPFSPINLIVYNTYTVEEMTYLWMAVEYNQSILFIGGTASGKTTSLNAVAQFVPKLTKVVSIEDTREITLSHENWIASIVPETSNVSEARHEITMFDLLKTAMRQRPDYIIVGEVRGIEAQTLFQAMNTGHTTFSTLHAENVDSAIHRLENEPLNVPKATMEALNIVVSQVRMYRNGKQVRRCNEIVEIVGLSENKNIMVNTVFKYHPDTDAPTYSGRAEVFSKIAERTGSTVRKVMAERDKRERILTAMLEQEIYDYRDVSYILWVYTVMPEKVIEALDDLQFVLNKRDKSGTWSDVEQLQEALN